MAMVPTRLPDTLRMIQRDVDRLEKDGVLRRFSPRHAYELRRVVLLLAGAIEQAEALAEARRPPSTREVEHQLHLLHQAGVVTPHAWWHRVLPRRGDAA